MTFQPWQIEKQLARMDDIRPILATEKRSAARDVACRAAAEQPRIINGRIPAGPPPASYLATGYAGAGSDLEAAVCAQLGLKPGSLAD